MPEVFLTPAAVDDLRRMRSEVSGLQMKPPRAAGAHARELSPWVTITSVTKTSGRYPGKIWTRDEANAAWVEGEACWVDTPNGATLATSTYYRGVVTDPSLGPGGSERPVVQVVGLGSSGSITVEEQDGSPSYTGISTVQVDQAAGMVLTNPAAGKALVSQSAASASAVGYVTTGTQTFAGEKTFADTPVTIGTVGGGAYRFYEATWDYTCWLAGDGEDAIGAQIEMAVFNTFRNTSLTITSHDNIAAIDTDRIPVFTFELTGANIIADRGGNVYPSLVLVGTDGSAQYGRTGTVADGSTFSGGLCTGVGTNFSFSNSTIKVGTGYFGNQDTTSQPTLANNQSAGPYFS